MSGIRIDSGPGAEGRKQAKAERQRHINRFQPALVETLDASDGKWADSDTEAGKTFNYLDRIMLDDASLESISKLIDRDHAKLESLGILNSVTKVFDRIKEMEGQSKV